MDFVAYRNKVSEQSRTADLMSLVPKACESVLDIGARDGWFSKLLAKNSSVIALDLETPKIKHPRVTCMQGDVTCLRFENNSFDLVFCVEVLEHIHNLKSACSEIQRVAKKYIIIGVPYKQDIRFNRTTCNTCGGKNPPWGHINSFNEKSLKNLFPNCDIKKISYTGKNSNYTNAFSVFLMDLAGNPYGVYDREEPCIYCHSKLKPPPERNLFQKFCTKFALLFRILQKPFIKPHPSWMHILFEKHV